jgi:DnaJ-class molecular chaperone
MAQDFYQVLGVDQKASDAEIKKAFRRLAKQYHPDKSGGDDAKFKRVNEAYEVLSDRKKRQSYDQFGEAAVHPGASGPGPFDFRQGSPFGIGQGYGGAGANPNIRFEYGTEDMDTDDIFGSLFGNRGRRAWPAAEQRAQDVQANLKISLREAFSGVTREVSLHGDEGGKIYRVKVPSGASSGSKVRFKGQGEKGLRGEPPGDLVITIEVAADPRFERDGNDLISTQTIPYPIAVLGGRIKVAVIDGEVALKIPPGTRDNAQFLIKGKGMPYAKGSSRGDHVVKLTIDVPRHLTVKQKALIEDLAKTMDV